MCVCFSLANSEQKLSIHLGTFSQITNISVNIIKLFRLEMFLFITVFVLERNLLLYTLMQSTGPPAP